MIERMIRAARLDSNLFEEVEHDSSATAQAALVVVIVAIASAISVAIGLAFSDRGSVMNGVISVLVSAIVGWVIWSYITYFVGTRLFAGTATPGELLRTIGFAQSPGVLNVIGFIPCIGWIVTAVVAVWTLIAGVIAVRQALDFGTGQAIATVAIGWLVNLVLRLILAVMGLSALPV
jgi:hypothetical protein